MKPRRSSTPWPPRSSPPSSRSSSSSIALLLIGHSPIEAFRAMWQYVDSADSVVAIINRAVPYYVAGVAVAIGFKMGLFNIGADGQYRLAALLAAAAGRRGDPAGAAACRCSSSSWPWSVGAAYAAIAGVLKVTRGVNEVVSTIMLNFIATGITAYLLAEYFRNTKRRPDRRDRSRSRASGTLPPLNRLLEVFGYHLPTGTVLQGFLPFAIVLGIAVLRRRLAHPLRLRAAHHGRQPGGVARPSGVNPKAMIMKTIMLSGAVAGLAGMGPLLRDRVPQVRRHLPDRHRLHRHRRRPARPQQPGRHRRRRLRVGRHRAGGAALPTDRRARRRSSRSCRARCCCPPSSPSRSCGATPPPPRSARRRRDGCARRHRGASRPARSP